MIKILQYFVLATFLISCKTKVNEVGLEVLKDGISEIEKRNQGWITILERRLSKGNFNSKAVGVDSAKAIIYRRDAAVRNKISLNNYGAYLFEKYKTCEIADSSRLVRAKKTLNIYNYSDKTDSLEYYQSLLSLLMLERDLIEEIGMNTGASDFKCMGFHIPIYSEHDTVKVNTSFTFIACGFETLRGSSVLKIHDKFKITLNGQKVNIPVDYKIVGNAIVVTATPNKAGAYVITGGMGIFDENLNYEASDTFMRRFYVID